MKLATDFKNLADRRQFLAANDNKYDGRPSKRKLGCPTAARYMKNKMVDEAMGFIIWSKLTESTGGFDLLDAQWFDLIQVEKGENPGFGVEYRMCGGVFTKPRGPERKAWRNSEQLSFLVEGTVDSRNVAFIGGLSTGSETAITARSRCTEGVCATEREIIRADSERHVRKIMPNECEIMDWAIEDNTAELIGTRLGFTKASAERKGKNAIDAAFRKLKIFNDRNKIIDF